MGTGLGGSLLRWLCGLTYLKQSPHRFGPVRRAGGKAEAIDRTSKRATPENQFRRPESTQESPPYANREQRSNRDVPARPHGRAASTFELLTLSNDTSHSPTSGKSVNRGNVPAARALAASEVVPTRVGCNVMFQSWKSLLD